MTDSRSAPIAEKQCTPFVTPPMTLAIAVLTWYTIFDLTVGGDIMIYTKRRIGLFAASCILPALTVALGLALYVSGMLINATVIIAFLLLPCLHTVGCYFVIFRGKTVWVQILLYIAVLIATFFVFSIVFTAGLVENLNVYKGEQVEEEYVSVTTEFPSMPMLTQIGSPTSLEYYDYYSHAFVIFTCEADTLICQYSATDYAAAKSQLADAYAFQQEPFSTYDGQCTPTAVIDGYEFRALADKEAELAYPKRMMLVGTNDLTQEIVYISFVDYDLDYIVSLEEFINTECGWKYIS